MSWRRPVEISIVGVFTAWFWLTALAQHSNKAFNKIRSMDNIFGNQLLPNWSFFAPVPAVEDVHVLYRFANFEKTEHSEWYEVEVFKEKRFWDPVWSPHCREQKALFDLTGSYSASRRSMVLSDDAQTKAIGEELAANMELILNEFVRSRAENHSKWDLQQVMLVRFAEHDADSEPQYDFILDYAPIKA